MQIGNWYSYSDGGPPGPAKHLVFSRERDGNVFRGYVDWNGGFYWEDRHGHRVGPFVTKVMAFESFYYFATAP